MKYFYLIKFIRYFYLNQQNSDYLQWVEEFNLWMSVFNLILFIVFFVLFFYVPVT